VTGQSNLRRFDPNTGLATGGLHPVVALYRLPVTFALDWAGVTADDGPSHNGMWNLSVLQVVPSLAVADPPGRDATARATQGGRGCFRCAGTRVPGPL
jgi:transketolase C-terminal domain/subunit